MKGLILETSTEKGCLLLTEEGHPLAFSPLPEGPALSKQLALETDTLLKKFDFKPQFIAVGTGPGSYTGTRVGVALAKALGYGWKIPVFNFCSLKAFCPLTKEPFAVVIDARMGGLYVLLHNADTPTLLSLDAAKQILHSIPHLISPHPHLIKKRIDLPGIWIEASPDIHLLAHLGTELFLRGEETDFTLTYLNLNLN
jgi:tRNA threonylcarbamoyladenosine biosynthesis protein TsaB